MVPGMPGKAGSGGGGLGGGLFVHPTANTPILELAYALLFNVELPHIPRAP